MSTLNVKLLVDAIGSLTILVAFLPMSAYTLCKISQEKMVSNRSRFLIIVGLITTTLCWTAFTTTRTQFAWTQFIYENNPISCKSQIYITLFLVWNSKLLIYAYFTERYVNMVRESPCNDRPFFVHSIRYLWAIVLLLFVMSNTVAPIAVLGGTYDPQNSRGLCTLVLLSIAQPFLVAGVVGEVLTQYSLLFCFVKFLSHIFSLRMQTLKEEEVPLSVFDDPTISASVKYFMLVSLSCLVTIVVYVNHFINGPRLLRFEFDSLMNCICMCLGLKYFSQTYLCLCPCHRCISIMLVFRLSPVAAKTFESRSEIPRVARVLTRDRASSTTTVSTDISQITRTSRGSTLSGVGEDSVQI